MSKLRVLHSAAPQSSFQDVLCVLRQDLKRDPYEVFESIEREPLGAASLAQVHRAVLKDGTQVALKVQHRAVKSNSYVDIKAMEALVRLTSWVFPEFKFQWLVDETKRNIPIELDFTLEGRNADKARQLYAARYSWLEIPRVRWELSSARVLAMEYASGGQVNDLEYLRRHDINTHEVSAKLGRLYSHMIFATGFVHSDPHPGNILVRKGSKGDAEIVLLDHGLYAQLTDDFRCEYSKLWLAILDGDRGAIREHCGRLGVGGDHLYGLLACMVAGRSWDTLMAGVARNRYDRREKEQFQREIPNLLPEISDVLQRVNRQMLLILKTNDLVRCIEHSLRTHSRMSAFVEMSKCCVRSVYAERLRSAETRWARLWLTAGQRWSLLKITAYYLYLGIINLDLAASLDSLWNNDFYPL